MDNDLKQRVREYYESHRISFSQLAKQSVRIFGTEISLEQIKHWSSQDTGWKKPPIPESEKLRIIANRAFEMIEESEDLTPTSFATLANVYLAFATKAPPEKLDDNRPTLQQIIDVAGKLKNGNLD